MFYKILITIVMAAMLVTSANAQTITPTGLSQGNLVALLQNIVNALGSSVGSTYLSVTTPISPTNQSGASWVEKYSADANGPFIAFDKSRNATVGSHTIVQSGDTLGAIYFAGSNGTTFSNAAYIAGFVDGTPGASNDMPGRLVFYTTPDGSATNTIRQIINNAGNVTIGATDLASNTSKLHSEGGSLIGAYVTSTGNTPLVIQRKSGVTGVTNILNFSAQNSASATTGLVQLISTMTDSTAASVDSSFQIQNMNASTLTTAFIINDSQAVSLAATDLAGDPTAAAAAGTKLWVGGRARLNGTVTGTNTGLSPVLDLEFFDESDSSTKTVQTPPAGYVSLLAVKTAAGKHALWMVYPGGGTVEVAIQP